MLLSFAAMMVAAAPPEKQVEAPPPPPPDPVIEVPRLLASASDGVSPADIVAKLKELPKKEVAPLVSGGLTHHDERVRLASIASVVAFRVTSARQSLAMALGDPAPEVVSAAALALHALGGKGADVEVRSLLKHRSVAVRCTVADIVRRQRGRKKLAALERQLERARLPEEKACVLAALHRGGARKVMGRVVPMIGDPDRRDLGVDVMKLDPAQSRTALSAALAKDPSEELVAGALVVTSGQGPAGLEWIAGLIRSKRENVRRAALDLLLSRSREKFVRGLLMEAAAKADIETRVRVIAAMVELGETGLLRLARKWLSDESPRIRAASARVLAGMPDKKDRGLVLRSYQNERMRMSADNLDTRVALLEAMGALTDPDWVPVLVEATGQKGEEQTATDALVAIGEPAVRTLLLVVKVGDMVRIPFALEALARIGTGVGDAAEGLFRHPRELVRELGRDLMAASGDPKAVPALLALFRSETLEDPVPLIQSIATFATAQARSALVEASDHPNDAVRVAALVGLGDSHRRSVDVVSAIVQMVEIDKVPAVRAAGVRALFQLNPPGFTKLLAKLVQFEVSEVRLTSYEALGWLGDPSVVTKMSPRLRDAEGVEAESLRSALRRLTRRSDLKSDRNYREWWEDTAPLLKGRKKTAGVVLSEGVKLHYRVSGGGQTVLVLGGGQSAAMFEPSLDRIGGKRFVYLDGPGRGKTAFGKGLSLKSELGDIERTRRALKAGRVAILAFGASGLIAIAYARTYPKRVSRVILVSSPPKGVRHGIENTAARRLKGAAAMDLARLDARHAWFAPTAWLGYRHTALAPGLVFDPKQGPLVAAFPVAPVAKQGLERIAQKIDARSMVAGMKTRIDFVLGAKSALTGAQVAALQRLAREHPHVSLRMVKNAGHYPHLERPSRFAALVRSLLGVAK